MYYLPETTTPIEFPSVIRSSKDGLVAVGGNLLAETLLDAYSKGIFPWFSEGDPILWWNPDPRMVLFTNQVRISSNMRKLLSKTRLKINSKTVFEPEKPQYTATFNQNFTQTVRECALKRGKNRQGTWILPEIQSSYELLFEKGYAHSVEIYNQSNELVGGLYGVGMGRFFFGESMFFHEPNASKLALIVLCKCLLKLGIPAIDCQVESPHLKSMGAFNIPRYEFVQLLHECQVAQGKPIIWDKIEPFDLLIDIS